MKIQAIRMQNLASLAGDTEIDFTREPLRSAGIFAITGPTGAGKSTILDAMCLALYARTPRYRLAESNIDISDVKGSTIKQDDVRGILRDGTPGGYAEVDFTGIDDQHYRATWRVRRARNKVDGRLQTYEMSLKNRTAGRDIPGKKTELLAEIERLVGLNFEQFTRSVLLAQGDFTAFLKAGKDEKSSLLEKLTGTIIYSEISKSVFEHHREEQQKLRELNLRRDGISTLTDEERTTLQAQKERLTTSIVAAEKQISELNKALNWHEQRLKLQERIQYAEMQYQQALAAKQAAKSREEHLQKVIAVQSVRPVVTALQNTSLQQGTRSEQLKMLETQRDTLEEDQKVSVEALEHARQQLRLKMKEEETAQPLLDKAKALETQCNEKKEQIQQLKKEADTLAHKQAHQQEQLAEFENVLTILEEEIKTRSRWKSENEFRRPVAEASSLIVSRLADAAEMLNSLKKYSARIRAAEGDRVKCQQTRHTLLEQRTKIQTLLQEEQGKCKLLNTTVSDIAIRNVEKEKHALDADIEKLIAAKAHWQLLYQAINEEEDLTRSLEENRQEEQRKIAALAEAEKSLAAIKSERAGARSMLERAKLAAAESVERLRQRLAPGDPCPVCGSIDHPYADHQPELNQVLAELEAAYEQQEAAYARQLKTHTGLHQSCLELERLRRTLEGKIVLNGQTIQELEGKWRKVQPAGACHEYPVAERAACIDRQLKQQKEKQQALWEKIQAYGKQKEQLETLQYHVTTLERQLSGLDNQLKDSERTLKSLEERQKNDREEQRHARRKLEAAERSLSVYFPSKQWFENWQTNQNDFVTRLQAFAHEWTTTVSQLDEQLQKQTISLEKRKALRAQSDSIHEQIAINKQKLSALQQQERELSDRRLALFKGLPVKEVAAGLKKAIDLAQKNLEEHRMTMENRQKDLARVGAQYEQVEKELGTLSRQEANFEKQLDDWMRLRQKKLEEPLTREELFRLLSYSQDWIEAERATLRAIDDTMMQTDSVLEECRKAWVIHTRGQGSEQTEEEVQTLQAESKELLKQITQQAHELDFKLKEDVSNRRRMGTLLQEIEKQELITENWARLNELIGSADGKKFRQIAQEYTLDLLLGYTNVHLEILSKRYILQRIPGSLGLQVIDQDMGEEVRTVYSLSGGESFLVSLALALGLASLSSSRMQVASLFIDEGFGSLDPATLNIAIDALERLHHQGRKVGVISHVQEMTERIPVQIKVSRQQRGKSKVEVVGV